MRLVRTKEQWTEYASWNSGSRCFDSTNYRLHASNRVEELKKELYMSRRMLHEVTTNNATAQQAEQLPDHSTIEALAYDHWLARGCPVGSPEIDWLRAEEEL